ncbi:MAG: hypothetical protein ACI4I4_03415 [Acutalibacteraceae bacterium]
MHIKRVTKMISAFALAACMALGCISAGAVGVKYTLPQINASINLPGNLMTVTRESKSTDTVFEKMSTTYKDVMNDMTQSHIYLIAQPEDLSYKLCVYMEETPQSKEDYNIKLLSDGRISSLMEEMKSEYKTELVSTTETNQALFFVCKAVKTADGQYVKNVVQQEQTLPSSAENATEDSTQAASSTGTAETTVKKTVKDNNTYLLVAETFVNGEKIKMTLASQGDEVSVDEAGVFNSALESVLFTDISKQPLDIDVAGIVLKVFICIVILAGLFWLIIYFKAKRSNRLESRSTAGAEKGGRKSVLDDFYEELEQDGLLDDKAEAKENVDRMEPESDNVFKNKPVRIELEIPKEKITPAQREREKMEEEKDSVELSRSNNEDYDEEVDEAVERSSKVRIFVGGGKSRIKNSVSAVGMRISYKDEQSNQVKRAVQIDEDFEKEFREKMNNSQKEETIAKKLQKNTATEDIINADDAKLNEQDGTDSMEKTTGRKSASERFKDDEVLSSFENDSYWDKYR